MDNKKYIGMDGHQASISVAVRIPQGNWLWNRSSKRKGRPFRNS
jgi:hypothetical protein